jgi:hypothetical protein
MSMGSETIDMYTPSGSFPPPISHTNIHSFGGSIWVHHTTFWPPQEYSQGQEQPQANLTLPQSNVSRINSPQMTREVSPASTSSSGQHHHGSRSQSAYITTSPQHCHGTCSGRSTTIDDLDLKPQTPSYMLQSVHAAGTWSASCYGGVCSASTTAMLGSTLAPLPSSRYEVMR